MLTLHIIGWIIYSIIKYSPFEIIYNPLVPSDLISLPVQERANMERNKQAEFTKQFHDKTKQNIKRITQRYTSCANKR